MSQRAELAIVIVNWNTLGLLRDCLRSVYENLGDLAARVVVVDNASCDGSPEMVQMEFPQVDLIRNKENRGFAAANNQAIRRSREDFVLLLNSDTVVLGDVLVESVAYLKANPNVGAMGCRVLNLDRSLQSSSSRFPSPYRLVIKATGLHRLPLRAFEIRHRHHHDEHDVEAIAGCYLMIRREAIARAGLLDEDFFFYGEETDWCRRIREAGFKLRFAPVGEIVHLGGGSGVRLDAERELMLYGALVRANKKRSGRASAAAAWVAMASFHLTRGCFWWLRAMLSQQPTMRAVGHQHFDVVRRSLEAWV